jgi:selenocysteine-specific elongation factor
MQGDELDSLRRAESAEVPVRVEEAFRQAAFESRTAARLSCETGVGPDEVDAMRQRLEREGKLTTFGGSGEVHVETISAVEDRAAAFLMRHHSANLAEPGVQRDRLITWLERRTTPGGGKALLSRLERAGIAVARGPYIAHRDFTPALSPEEAALLEQLVAEVAAARFDPPVWAALKATRGLSRQRIRLLEDIAKSDRRLVLFEPQHYIAAAALEEFKAAVIKLADGRKFKLAEVRDALGLSRRAVQPLLEHLDRVGFTRRIGDERVLVESVAQVPRQQREQRR